MELTKKQIILIAAISGAILLLTVAAILIFVPGDGETLPEPTVTPQATDSPVPTPSPALTPSPTAFRLPLVPQFETPQSPDPAGAVEARLWGRASLPNRGRRLTGISTLTGFCLRRFGCVSSCRRESAVSMTAVR